MIPKILCTDCGSQLQWTDKFCSRCGKTIEWPASFSSSPTSPAPTALPVRSTTLRVDRLVEQAGVQDKKPISEVQKAATEVKKDAVYGSGLSGDQVEKIIKEFTKK